MEIEVIDYQKEAKERVTSIFKESPLYLSLIDSIVSAYEQQQYDLLSLNNSLLDIDNAEKSQLDFIGRIVGQSRLLSSFNTEPYFGFEGSYQSETFGTVDDESVGGYWNSYEDYKPSTARRLNDDEYRRLIKARIIKNNSNCTINDLIKVLNLLSNSTTASVSRPEHGSLKITVNDKDGFIAYYIDKIGLEDEILPIPAGVRLWQYQYEDGGGSVISCEGATDGINFPNFYGLWDIEFDGVHHTTDGNYVAPYIRSHFSDILEANDDDWMEIINIDSVAHRIKLTPRNNPLYPNGFTIPTNNPTFVQYDDGSIAFCLSTSTP